MKILTVWFPAWKILQTDIKQPRPPNQRAPNGATIMITSTDYTGKACTLTHNGQPVSAGEILEDFRGDQYRVTGGQAPHKPSSSGKIYTDGGNYYPTVFGCQWTPSN